MRFSLTVPFLLAVSLVSAEPVMTPGELPRVPATPPVPPLRSK